MILASSLALLAAACGGDEAEMGAAQSPESTTAAPSPEAPSPENTTLSPMQDGAIVELAESELGAILVDGEGRTLYAFLNDSAGESTCYDECADNWPAFETEGDPQAGDGVDVSLLGTTERDDGGLQVAFDQLPLYYFAGDEAPGDTNGQGIGEVWYVVSPEGEPVDGPRDQPYP